MANRSSDKLQGLSILELSEVIRADFETRQYYVTGRLTKAIYAGVIAAAATLERAGSECEPLPRQEAARDPPCPPVHVGSVRLLRRTDALARLAAKREGLREETRRGWHMTAFGGRVPADDCYFDAPDPDMPVTGGGQRERRKPEGRGGRLAGCACWRRGD